MRSEDTLNKVTSMSAHRMKSHTRMKSHMGWNDSCQKGATPERARPEERRSLSSHTEQPSPAPFCRPKSIARDEMRVQREGIKEEEGPPPHTHTRTGDEVAEDALEKEKE